MSKRNIKVAFVAAMGFILPASVAGAQTVPQAPPMAGQVQQAPTSYSLELSPGVVFEVVELRRLADQGVVQLKFAVTNKSGQETSLKAEGIAYCAVFNDGCSIEKINLIDPVGQKTYQIGRADRCLCSTFNESGAVKNGQRREFWAWYALPPPATQRLTIQVAGQPPMTNVPLQQ